MIKCRSQGLLVNHDGTVWPCCWTLTLKERSSTLKKLDPEWNSLHKHDIDTILNHKMFTVHFNDNHWENPDKCDEICKRWCSI